MVSLTKMMVFCCVISVVLMLTRVVVVMMLCVVVELDIRKVRRLGKHLDHRMHTEPGNSSNDQCHAHECCML